MLKETKTKMLVQVWDVLHKAVKRDLRSLHIMRDTYLNALFAREIEELEREVKFVLPDEVCRYIKRRLRGLKRERVTIAVDRDVEGRLNRVLNERNIPRDAFVNRILFFLVAKPSHLRTLGIGYERRQEVVVKPLDDAWTFLHDPFSNIRMSNDGTFYTLVLPDEPLGEKWPNLFGLNCAISAETWKLITTGRDALLDELGLGEVFA